MYDNISVEQSGKGLGRILKTSPDLSTVAVIANARQGENVSPLMSHGHRERARASPADAGGNFGKDTGGG